MGYYDGNTVTAMWNYAQHYAMSDNSYDTGFGPSTVGALNLIAGQTNGVSHPENGTGEETSDGSGGAERHRRSGSVPRQVLRFDHARRSK